MPNHVKNRLVIIGADEAVKDVIEKLSTHYPSVPGKSYDGQTRYKMITGEGEWDYECGFLNEETNEFWRRGMDTVIGVPEGFKIDMEDAWTRFPDFNKIIPMPESLNITSDNFVSAMDSNRFHKDDLFLESLKNVKEYAEKQNEHEEGRGEETIKNFLTGVDNYLRYGYATWYGWAPDNWGTKWNAYSCKKVNDNTFTFETAWSGVPDLMKEMSKLYPNVTFEYAWADEDTGSNCGRATFKTGLADIEEIANGSNEAYELAFELRPDSKEYYELVDGEYQYKDED